jgi:ABC-type polysaccharide/polyol phosphate export permease
MSRRVPSAEPLLVSTARRPALYACLQEVWRQRELVVELAKRALLLRYKNSALGIAWSLVTPLMLVFVITMMTRLFLNQAIPNYSAFLFPVMFAWTFFTTCIPDMCSTLLENALMIRRVYFAWELLPVAVLLANLFHLLIALGLALIYFVMLRIFPQQVSWKVLLLFLIVPAHSLITLGIGFVVSALNVLFEDVRFMVNVLLQLCWYVVPVLYPIERVAAAAQHPWHAGLLETWVRPHLLQLYLLNPFAAVLVLYQKALLPPIRNAGHDALPWSWALLGQTWLMAILVFLGGLWFFHRLKWASVERL